MTGDNAPKIQMPDGAGDVIQRPSAGPQSDKVQKRQRKEKRQEPQAANAPKRRRKGDRTRLIIQLGAVTLGTLWLAGFAAFVVGFQLANEVPILSMPPGIWGGVIAAALLPVGFITVGAFVLLRLVDVERTANRLAAISRELIDPGTTAANDVAKLGATIRKELEGLNREVDGAVARVGALESRLRQQTTLIEETGARVEKRTGDMTAKLSQEREKVDAISRSLSAEGKIIKDAFETQAFEIERAQKKAVEALKEAEDELETRRQGLDTAAAAAAA